MTEQMEVSFRTADRVRIRYAEAGRGVGETVVLTVPPSPSTMSCSIPSATPTTRIRLTRPVG